MPRFLRLLSARARAPHPDRPQNPPTDDRPRRYTATVLLNVTTGPRGEALHLFGYQHGQPLALVEVLGDGPLVLTVDTSTIDAAANSVFIIGNGSFADSLGRSWPGGVRWVSIGDVLQITDPGGDVHYLAVASDTLDPVDAPTNLVPLLGSTATSHP
ncbi:hypothetical protein [Kitasatospora sp. NPDC088779]|uniref:hypothetical protein n=1 Tax=unclassified Kitasatospora TaxID=2633591 RepID=UPI00342127C5